MSEIRRPIKLFKKSLCPSIKERVVTAIKHKKNPRIAKEIAKELGVREETVMRTLRWLREGGLVEQQAGFNRITGRPITLWVLTDIGEKAANHLGEIARLYRCVRRLVGP